MDSNLRCSWSRIPCRSTTSDTFTPSLPVPVVANAPAKLRRACSASPSATAVPRAASFSRLLDGGRSTIGPIGTLLRLMVFKRPVNPKGEDRCHQKRNDAQLGAKLVHEVDATGYPVTKHDDGSNPATTIYSVGQDERHS